MTSVARRLGFVARQLAQWTVLLAVALLTVLIVLPVAALGAVLVRVGRWIAAAVSPPPRSTAASKTAAADTTITVGFFHPYCNAGGGGERVLWCAVQAVRELLPAAIRARTASSSSSTPSDSGIIASVRCVIFTGDVDAGSGKAILDKARKSFGFTPAQLPDEHIQFVFLRSRPWVEAAPYPFLTLLGQSLGSLVLGYEALFASLASPAVRPDVFLDTMGFAFVLPLFRWLLRCKVGCYVHYPTISTDMIARVRDRTAAHNNSALVARYPLLSHGKLAYYRGFALLYSLVGSCAELVMVNSSWTRGHVAQLWHLDRQPVFRLGDELLAATETAAFEKHAHAAATASSTGGTTRSGKSYNTEPAAGSSTSSSSDPTQRLRLLYASPDSRQDAFAPVFERLNKALHANAIVLYPPCNTTLLRAFPLQSRSASPATIVSVAQFRPEKDHALQVRALAEALRLQPQLRGKVRLALVGSCRHADDQARVDSLRKLAHELGVEHEVELLVGVSHEVLRAQLAGAVGGMHTMWNEHFGIGVVEYMAAGAVAIAHHSGGPLMDIVTPFRGQPTGYLATTKEEYAQAILALLAMKDSERHAMQERARASVSSRFSDEVFACGFAEAVATLVCAHR